MECDSLIESSKGISIFLEENALCDKIWHVTTKPGFVQMHITLAYSGAVGHITMMRLLFWQYD